MNERRFEDFDEFPFSVAGSVALTELAGHGLGVYAMLTGKADDPVLLLLQISFGCAIVGLGLGFFVAMCWTPLSLLVGLFKDLIGFVDHEADPTGWWVERLKAARKLVYGLVFLASVAGLFLGPALIAYSAKHGQRHTEHGVTWWWIVLYCAVIGVMLPWLAYFVLRFMVAVVWGLLVRPSYELLSPWMRQPVASTNPVLVQGTTDDSTVKPQGGFRNWMKDRLRSWWKELWDLMGWGGDEESEKIRP